MKVKKKDNIIEIIENPDNYDSELVLRAKVVLQFIELREKRHLNQTEAAELVGVSHQAIAKFESMGNSPTLSFLVKYSEALRGTVEMKVKPQRKKK